MAIVAEISAIAVFGELRNFRPRLRILTRARKSRRRGSVSFPAVACKRAGCSPKYVGDAFSEVESLRLTSRNVGVLHPNCLPLDSGATFALLHL
jgi:hypothetical protein